ncbi:hypothetical protein MTR67_047371 [Solanum verrucosum]|uniref:Uncharacterized protein n=1 Tax=Solanum verrucosum TaxID=315347 RepID=A0AAF0ZWG2_SOLVR|nr:hypothetical protein MTR67_047371 [Solanum verrucosum]
MAKVLLGKLTDDIKDHCNVLIEDINIIESGYVHYLIILKCKTRINTLN